jgi:hypothetical protein
MKPKHPPGDPMTLGNMRELGVQNLRSMSHNPGSDEQTFGAE